MVSSIEIVVVKKFIVNNIEELIALRRWFHQHPETSYKEFETNNKIIEVLKDYGYGNMRTVAKTGVILDIEGTDGSKTFGFRFNIDGLAIPEKNNTSYKSKFQGFSHACGHDFEIAWGLLIAKYFSVKKPNTNIRLIFQPAEEGPGEDEFSRTGGQFIHELGLFDIDGIFSLHVDPSLPLGTISIASGKITGDAFDFKIKLQGKMGHASKPQEAINPILAIPKLITRIENLNHNTKEHLRDDDFGFITITEVKSHYNESESTFYEPLNTIPEFVEIGGIIRCRFENTQFDIKKELENIVSSFEDNSTKLFIDIERRAFATVNNPFMVEGIQTYINSSNDLSLKEIKSKWRDDAGWASLSAPTAHGFVGIKDNHIENNLHTPFFLPTEDALAIGLRIFLNSINIITNKLS